MKITLFLSFFCVFHLMAINTDAQNAIIKLPSKTLSVGELIKEIEKQTDYLVVYSNSEIDTKKSVSVSSQSGKVGDYLKTVFNGTNIRYIFENDYIVLTTKATAPTPLQKSRTLSGTVRDEKGETIPGASVVVIGTTTGAITDLDGRFSFSHDQGTILRVSFLGYTAKQMPIGSQTKFDVTLIEDTKALEEVVVVGYGTMKKSDINASIVSVKSDDLVKVSTPDFSEMLMGRAAGLTVKQVSAQPGGGIEILIRGGASTGAGNQPLYVIDGFPVVNAGTSPGSGNQWQSGYHSPMSDINPNDIASIEILKDASATAIYGARGANGVVLITTKRGTKNTKVEYSMSTSVQTIIKKPELLNAGEFMVERDRYFKEQYLMNNKLYPYGNNDPSGVSPYVPQYTADEIAAAGRGTNWYDKITRTGKVNQHNLTITYGNDDMKSLISFNYFGQDGVVRTSAYQRYSLRYNLDHKIASWWDYGISSLASMTKEENAALGGGRDATAGIIESALTYSPLVKPERNSQGAWIEDPNQALLNHPLSYMDIEDKTKNKRFLTSVYTNFHILKDVLWLKLSAGGDIRDGLRQNYYPTTTRYGSAIGGDANINSQYREDYMADAVINFQKTFNKHKFLTLAGYSYQVQNGEEAYARAMGFTSDLLSYYKLQAGEKRPVVSSYKEKHVLASYFGRLQYSFNDRYLFTFTGRVDGSDRFGANNRYAFFPSGAFAWRLNQEDFMKDVNWVSDGKLRLSIGQVGNEGIPNGAASEYYSFDGRNYYFGDSEKRGINLGKFGNPNLKWETTTEVNFGIDYGFLRNRINGSIDVFYKEIKDLLSWRKLPHTSIIGNVASNIGKTQSKGFELTLNTINLEGPLQWESSLTYTSYRDKWLKRDPKTILPPYVRSNAPITAVYALIPDGIKQPGESTPSMPDLQPGQQKYKDVNGVDENGNLTGKPDGKIDHADVQYVGTTAPKFTMGLSNTFRYKEFDLNFFLYASVGAYRWPSTQVEHGVYSGYGVQMLRDNYNYLKEIQNRWTSDNMNTNMPSGNVSNYDGYGLPNWEKASYLRLKSLSLGYNIGSLLKAKRIDARISLTAQNLFTITGYNGFDPEVESDRAAYPQQRTFSVGLNLKF